MKRIALFNHKEGVGKTVSTFNLGWALASLGYTTLLIDMDPECDLTAMVLHYAGSDDFEQFYRQSPGRNIKDALAPAFESAPTLMEPVECIPIQDQDKLYLLPGHVRLAEYQILLSMAQQWSGSIPSLSNLPGSIDYLLTKTGENIQADFMLIDMGSSLSSINQNILMTTDYFIIPCSSNYFSFLSIESSATVLPRWHHWAKKVQRDPYLREAEYPLHERVPQFLGTIILNSPVANHTLPEHQREFIDKIDDAVEGNLVSELREIGMLLPENKYSSAGIDSKLCLARVNDFSALIAPSYKQQIPIWRLKEEHFELEDDALKNALQERDRFKTVFLSLAEKIVELTSDDSSSGAVPEQHRAYA